MINVAILASGSGSNAQRLIEYFSDNKNINFPLIITNKEDAYVRERAKFLNVTSVYINNKSLKTGETLLNILQENNIDWVILAGYLLLIPSNVVNVYNGRIINIHPALLPKYGGKSMYGMNVHKAVINNKDTESGITIHYVNEKYDDGNIIFQAKCPITKDDSSETLAGKIHLLEYEFFPKVIENIILQKD